MHDSEATIAGSEQQPGTLPRDARIFLAGHQGMVGSAIYRCLQAQQYSNIITRSHNELDLVDQAAVRQFFAEENIDAVILAAARVGGIRANDTYRAEFIFENIMIQTNVIHEAYRSGVRRLLFLGSSCIYPKYAQQPMREEQLLTGILEPTNEPYAIAKIAGIKLCESYNRQYGTHYRSIMPTNLYGPNDNFDLENSHVLPAMIRKFHLAKLASQRNWQQIEKDEDVYGPISTDFKEGLKAITAAKPDGSGRAPAIELWGSGRPKREFLHVDDLAAACLFVNNLADDVYAAGCAASDQQPHSPAQTESTDSVHSDFSHRGPVYHINVGSGEDIYIAELAQIVQKIVGYEGAIRWNTAKPDGTPRKLLDITRITQMGWSARIGLNEGIKRTYSWYLAQSELH
ncbi:MAG: GDP-L-fucose synthase [Desulfobacterales bacterium]|jgi:GDP-L-fucose synthase